MDSKIYSRIDNLLLTTWLHDVGHQLTSLNTSIRRLDLELDNKIPHNEAKNVLKKIENSAGYINDSFRSITSLFRSYSEEAFKIEEVIYDLRELNSQILMKGVDFEVIRPQSEQLPIYGYKKLFAGTLLGIMLTYKSNGFQVKLSYDSDPENVRINLVGFGRGNFRNLYIETNVLVLENNFNANVILSDSTNEIIIDIPTSK